MILDLGITRPVDATVVAFAGPMLVLLLGGDDDVALRLSVDAPLTGYVMIEGSDPPRALRVIADCPAAGGDELTLRLIDDFRLGQQRFYARAPLEVPVVLEPLDTRDFSFVETTSIDLSCGGVRIVRPDHDGGSIEYRVTLDLDEDGRVIIGRAELHRQDADELVLVFDQIGLAERCAIMRGVIRWHRTRALLRGH